MTDLSMSAQQVQQEYLQYAQNPVWRLAFEIALGEWMRDIATYHQGPIQAITDRAVLRQLNATRDDITKRFLLDRIEEIRKEDEWDSTKHKRGGNPRNRGQFSRSSTIGGQAAQAQRERTLNNAGTSIGEAMGANLRFGGPSTRTRNYGPIPPSARRQQTTAVLNQEREHMLATGQIPEATAQRTVGLAAKPVVLSASTSPTDHQAEVFRRQAAMTYALEEKTRNAQDKQHVQYTITGPRGSRIEVPNAGVMPTVDWEGGERVKLMTPVGPDNPTTVAGKVMDIGMVAGLDHEAASKAGSVVSDIHDTLNTTDWGQRLTNVANVARVVSNNSPVAAQATAVAGLINLLGPDAARAFGPKMRQLSYRYAGQEASPMQMSNVARGGKQEGETNEAYEARLAIDLARSLPSKTDYRAALQAGSTPPSKGYILDKNGKVRSEAVGYADDWYTPFNLRKLPKLKDGSYVRTRGYGGITPEDITLAMRTGARRVTVVSNSGVFSLEFDDRAMKSGHRYGFGGASMQRRYAKSLDALHNGRVTNSDQNIGTRAERGINQFGYATALSDLKNKYPYFIKKVSAGPPINRLAQREGEGPIGSESRDERDEGYVRPLRLRASGAQYGWADPGVVNVHGFRGEPAGPPGRSRVPYDQLEEYRLRRGPGGIDNGPDNLGGGGGGGGGGNRPAGGGGGGSGGGGRHFVAGANGTLQQVGESRSDPPVPGGRMQERAYDSPSAKIETADANRMLADFKAIREQHPDIEVSEQLDGILDGATSEKNSGPWQKARDRLRDNEELRTSVLDEMNEHFGETDTGRSLLPQLSALVVGTGDDEAAAEEDDDDLNYAEHGYYGASDTIAPEVLRDSKLYQAFRRQQFNRSDAAGVQMQKDIALWERVNVADHGNDEWDTYNKTLSTGEKERFNDIQARVNRLINDEIQIAEDNRRETGTVRDDEEPEQGEEPEREAIQFNPREALDSPNPRNFAMDLVARISQEVDEPDEQRRMVTRLSEAAKRAANGHPTEAGKEKLFEVGDAFDTALEWMENMEPKHEDEE